MQPIYINGDEVRITRTDMCLVTVEFFNGPTFENLEPRRLFPVTGLRKYITLLDSELKEKAIIRNLDLLIPESKQAIEECLDEYYLIPHITCIHSITEKFGIFTWDVETNRGRKKFRVVNRMRDLKALYDGRILVRDGDDNRYEIPNISDLDKRSQQLLNNEL